MQIIGTAKAFNKAKNRVCLQPSSVYLMNHTLVLILSLLWTKHQFNTRIAFFFARFMIFLEQKMRLLRQYNLLCWLEVKYDWRLLMVNDGKNKFKQVTSLGLQISKRLSCCWWCAHVWSYIIWQKLYLTADVIYSLRRIYLSHSIVNCSQF